MLSMLAVCSNNKSSETSSPAANTNQESANLADNISKAENTTLKMIYWDPTTKDIV